MQPDLLKAEDVRTHICAIFLRICAEFGLLNAKQDKQALFLMVLTQFDKSLQSFMCFYGILGPFLCAKLSVRKFGCATFVAFIRSDFHPQKNRKKKNYMILKYQTNASVYPHKPYSHSIHYIFHSYVFKKVPSQLFHYLIFFSNIGYFL